MATVEQASTRDLIVSLASDTCPVCGRPKEPRQTLCRSDYFRLPRPIRVALYDRIGDGYEEAIQRAFGRLGVTEFRMPPEGQGGGRGRQ